MEKTQPRNIIPFNPRSFNKSVIPERMPDQALVDKLFLLFQEGNITSIKNFLITNNLTTSVLNSDGETLLHLVLKNKTLTPLEKNGLAKLIEEKGSIDQSYDKNFVTPLHLASKHQAGKIVSMLLNHSHDVNALDNTYKTPLHYAVNGEAMGSCPVPSTKKKSTLIQSKKTKKYELKNLSDIIARFINNNDTCKMYMKHISNLFNKSNTVFKDLFDNIFKKERTLLTEAEKAGKTKEEKNALVEKIYNDSRMEIYNAILDNIKNTTGNLDIRPNNTWGPTNDAFNRVLPYSDLNEFQTAFKNNYISLSKKTRRELISKTTELLVGLNKSDDLLEKLEQSMNDVDYLVRYGIEITHPNVGAGGAGGPRVDLGIIDIIHINAFIDSLKYPNGIVMESPLFSTSLQNIHFDASLLVDITGDEDISENVRVGLNGGRYFSTLPEDHNNPPKYPPQFFGKTSDNAGVVNQNVPVQDYPQNGIDGTFLCYKLSILNYLIVNSRETIKSIINDLNILENIEKFPLELGDDKLLTIHDTIRNFLNQLLTLSYLLYLFDNEIDNVIKQLKESKNKINDVIDNINDVGNDATDFFKQICSKIVDELDMQIKTLEKFKPTIQTIYNNIVGVHKNFNKVINLINERSSLEYIVKFNNEFTIDFNATIAEQNISQLNEIFRTYFTDIIPELPQTYDKFIRYLEQYDGINHDTNRKNKKTITENFAILIDQLNEPIYLEDNLNENGRHGYLFNTDLDTDAAGNPVVGVITTVAPNLEPRNGNLISPNGFDNFVNNEIGSIRIENALDGQKDSDDIIIPIIGRSIDIHLEIIKYIIVRKIIEYVFNLLNRGVVPTNPLDLALFNELKVINDNIDDSLKSSDDDKGVLLSIVGTLTDELFTWNVSNIIYKNINNLIARNQQIIGYEILKQQDKQVPFSIEDIQEELLDKFSDLRNKTKEYLSRFYDPAEEEIENNSYYKLFSTDKLTDPFDKCFAYDDTIVEMLLRAGANPNIKDREGNTPIFDTVNSGNLRAFNLLANNNAILNNPRYKNKYGYTAYEFLNNLFDTSLSKLHDPNEITLLSETVSSTLSKKTQYNRKLRYDNIILPMALYLLNHLFYFLAGKYPRNWKFDDHKKINSLMENPKKQLPLIDIYDENIRKIVSDNKVKDNISKNVLNKELSGMNDEQIMKRRLQLEQEYDELNILPKPLTHMQEARMLEIQEILHDIDNILTNNGIENRKLERNIRKTTIEFERFVDSRSKIFEKQISKMPKAESNMIGMYNTLFRTLIHENKKKNNVSPDYKQYTNLWKLLIEKKQRDITQINSNLVNLLKTNKNEDNIILLKNYSSNIAYPFVRDYMELPDQYNGSNYALTEIINIIIHVIKHTICLNLFNIIIKLIDNNVRSVILKNEGMNDDEYENKIMTTIRTIIKQSGLTNDKFGSDLEKYIFDKLPVKAVKVALQVFEDEIDPDIPSQMSDILSHVLTIISSNKNLYLQKTKFEDEVKTYVIPYFKEYLETYIKAIKNMFESYMRGLLVLNTYTNMMVIANDNLKKVSI